MLAVLLACLAQVPALEPDSAFVGTWEMTSLSTLGRPRPGRALLVVEPGEVGKAAAWTWDSASTRNQDLVTTRKAGQPFPAIRREVKDDRRSIARLHFVEEGVYRLKDDTLTVAWLYRSAPIRAGDDPFLPAAGRSVETYRRVRREPDLTYKPARFPTGPATLLATWDVAARGVLQGAPRGIVSHHAAYDLGDGVRVIFARGSEFLDDPPAPDVEEKDVPTGTIIRPSGGKFDEKTYEVAYPPQSPEARAVIDAFRAQDPVPPDRELHYPYQFPKSLLPGSRVFGWDGLLISARRRGDRTIADILISPRLWSVSCHGNRVVSSHGPLLVETWELRDGKLHYLMGGPELPEEGGPSSRPPVWPDPNPRAFTGITTIPRPAHLPPVSNARVFGTSVHYRPNTIDLEDSTRNSTEAGPRITRAPAPSSRSITRSPRCPPCHRRPPGKNSSKRS